MDDGALQPLAPPLAPDERVATGTEREVFEAFLDMYRAIVAGKLAGLQERDARRSLVPSATTLIGVVQHLAGVEREWFSQILGGATPDGPVPAGDGWVVTPARTVPEVLDDDRRACAAARAAAARFRLDDAVPHPRLGRVSLRWIYVHMIEETARHAGHADILREQTDGTTGFD